MPLGSANLYSQLDSQDAAKRLQMVWRVAVSQSHSAIPAHFGRWSTVLVLLLTRPQFCLLCQKICKKHHHSLPTDLRSISHANVRTRFTIFQVAAMNLKNMHICVCHIHTPYLFILTVGEMCHLPALPRYYQTHQKLLLHLGMNPTSRCLHTSLKV